MLDKYYLTTAIDYVNGAPHIGHAYEKILTDILARHYSLRTDNMFFLTGTDEHGIKIQKTASAQGITPKQLCDENSQKFKDAWAKLDVKYNRFIRTTDLDHEKVVQKIFQKLKDKGAIYKHEYEGWYCQGCECFLNPKDLTEDGLCPDHLKKPDVVKEENYFFKLTDYKDKWGVLFFYPFDFTFVCPTEICSFSDASDNFAKINTQIIGASCDSIFVHREFALRERKQGGVAPLKIPLLADNTHEISMKYGCYIHKGESKGCTFRATYIIDPKGIIRHISINDTPVGRSVDEVMRLVQAFQFTDEHGEVCPSNWKPGRKTMKPKPGDPDLKKYFEDELAKQK